MAENCTFPERDAFAPPDPPNAADAIGDWTPSDDAATGKWGKVTESADVDGLVVYGFTEQDPVATPSVYTLKTGGIVGRPWSNPAKEENSNPSVPVDTYIHIFPGLRVEPSGHANVTQHGNSSLSHHTIQEAFIRDGGGGTFALVYNDGSALYTTGPLSLGANATAVKNALEALSNITSVNVSGNGHIGDPYNITFLDSFADIANLTFDLNQTEWSQEWYFKHQPTSAGGGNGTSVNVYLQSDNGNGTFSGLALLPNNLTLPTVPTSVLVYTKAHTPPADGGLQDFGGSYFAVGQVIEGFYTGQSSAGLPIVYPQHVPPLANLTVPGLVSVSNQTLGRGYKMVEVLTLPFGQNSAIATSPDNGLKVMAGVTDFLASASRTETILQVGSPLDIYRGFDISIAPTGIDYTLEFSNLPVLYPSLVLNLMDNSGAVGSGGLGVQDYQVYRGCTTLEIIHNGDNNPLPGVILALGWVCGGQLSLGDCIYFQGTPSAYTNQTFSTIITGIYNQANLGNLSLPVGPVADSTDGTDAATQLNALLAALRTAGILSP